MIHTMIDGRAHMSGMRRDVDFGLSPPCTRSLLTCATHGMAATPIAPLPRRTIVATSVQ